MNQQPPAYGYQPPAPYFKRDLETEKGVKHIFWGILIFILATLLTFAGFLVAFLFVDEIIANEPAPGEIPEDFGLLLGAVGLLCGGLLLILITLVMWLLGVYEMHKGKNEFGSQHSARVSKAVIFIVLYIVLLVLGGFVAVAAGVNSASDFDTYLESLRTTAIVGSTLDIIATFFLGLAFVYLVIELSDEGTKNTLWAGFVAFVVISVVGTVLSIVPLYGEFTGTEVSQLRQAEAMTSLAMGLSFIPFLMFLVAYRRVYIRVKEGEIQPEVEAYPQMYPGPPVPYPQQTAYEHQPYSRQPPYEQPLPGQSARVCPSCGNPTNPGETFCANCGARLQ
jgi:heme/copper-type cytochrome/quinol oxidase subunit 3